MACSTPPLSHPSPTDKASTGKLNKYVNGGSQTFAAIEHKFLISAMHDPSISQTACPCTVHDHCQLLHAQEPYSSIDVRGGAN